MAEYKNPDVLVETDWLEANIDDSNLAIIEVDEDIDAYQKGHISNAVAINWADELRSLPNRDFISSEQLATLLGERGISDQQTIVLYGGNNNWFATYAYWLFKLRGVENVKLLNGGRKKWELESRLLVQDEPNRSATTFNIGSEQPEIRIFRDDVIARAKESGKAWVDVRSPEEFRGELSAPAHLPQEAAQRKGHIPGAVNVPWSQAVAEDGTFKPIDELRELYGARGVDGSEEIVAYCRIGERSSHTWFVLHELLGFGEVRNYDGSWTEYGSLVGVPIETGEASSN